MGSKTNYVLKNKLNLKSLDLKTLIDVWTKGSLLSWQQGYGNKGEGGLNVNKAVTTDCVLKAPQPASRGSKSAGIHINRHQK